MQPSCNVAHRVSPSIRSLQLSRDTNPNILPLSCPPYLLNYRCCYNLERENSEPIVDLLAYQGDEVNEFIFNSRNSICYWAMDIVSCMKSSLAPSNEYQADMISNIDANRFSSLPHCAITIFIKNPHRVLNDNHCGWIDANQDHCSSLSNDLRRAHSITVPSK